jgi:O-acetyl-ADP-ribose deacetylase (regulator of RNase III)
MIKKIVLCDLKEGLIEKWKEAFKDVSFVETYLGNIFDIEADAYVSPANSFGFMDGGIDLAYSNYFPNIQKTVQDKIKDSVFKELTIGNALIVETKNERIPFLICSPTMRTPTMLSVNSVNCYLSTKAALQIAQTEEKIETIVFPGMGTGIGKVSFETCANQMKAAVKNVLISPQAYPKTLFEASQYQYSLIKDEEDFMSSLIN